MSLPNVPGPKPMELHPHLVKALNNLLKSNLPPLPPLSGSLSITCRAHVSFKNVKRSEHEEPVGSKANDYERLEFMGDSMLTTTIKLLMDELYPRATVETRTSLHDALVCNEALSYLSLAYKLPSRLLASPASGHALSLTPSIQADIFESYIGASLDKNGRAETMSWLRTLYDPLIKAGYQDQYDKWQALVNAGLSEAPALDLEADEIVYQKNFASWIHIWAQRSKRVIKIVKTVDSPNAGSIWLDGEKEAELAGELGEKWQSVKEN